MGQKPSRKLIPKSTCGRVKKDGTPCKHRAGHGTDHVGFGKCKFHGGTSPSGKVHAEREMVEAHMVRFGGPVEIEAHAALIQEVQRTAGHVEWLSLKIRDLADDADLTQLTGGGSESWPKRVPGAWVDMYQSERAHLIRAAKTAIDAGVAERQVQIAESQGRLLAEVITAILDDLKLNKEQRKLAPGVVRRHLTVVGE